MTLFQNILVKGVVMIFCWGGPDFKPQTDERDNENQTFQHFISAQVFQFYSGVGPAHLPPPPLATPLILVQKLSVCLQ
jgi:hypothetical protein